MAFFKADNPFRFEKATLTDTDCVKEEEEDDEERERGANSWRMNAFFFSIDARDFANFFLWRDARDFATCFPGVVSVGGTRFRSIEPLDALPRPTLGDYSSSRMGGWMHVISRWKSGKKKTNVQLPTAHLCRDDEQLSFCVGRFSDARDSGQERRKTYLPNPTTLLAPFAAAFSQELPSE